MNGSVGAGGRLAWTPVPGVGAGLVQAWPTPRGPLAWGIEQICRPVLVRPVSVDKRKGPDSHWESPSLEAHCGAAEEGLGMPPGRPV